MTTTTVPTPHRTPLRRLSQGSLFRLSRSGVYPDAPHGLGFLEPALGELLDEMEALQANVAGLKNLSDALETFNESFASWLYVMNMNALTTDWPQAPTPLSFKYAAQRAEEDMIAATRALEAMRTTPQPAAPSADMTVVEATTEPGNETTYSANATASGPPGASSEGTKTVAKKKGKIKLSAREKKERSLSIERIVNTLPLEFRGSDPNLRRQIEIVIEGFLDREGRGLTIIELVKPPDLNQARVNKCLIALVNRKIVRKDNSTGAVLYHWHGLPG